jgi:O-antigen/teichoic acid export membrane protein
LPFGLRLPGIVFLLVLARFAATLGYVAISLRIFPVLRKRVEFRPALLRQLLTYGGWVTVSNVVNPLLVYMDRFFIAAMMMASALAFYSVPFEVVTRLWIVASGLATTLFPAFSTLDSSGQRNRLESLYSRSLKYMLVVVTPVVLVLIVFARDILNIWLGADFAARSTLPMQILAVGVLTNSLTYLPYSLLQALNRPAAVAKLFAIELPCYAALLPFMISHFGIVGGAVAWCVRVTVEAFVFLVVAQKLLSLSPRVWTDRGLRASMGAVVLLSAALLPISVFLGGALVLRGGICSACLAVFVWVVWRHILNDVDRGLVRTMVGPAVGTARR